MTDGPTKRPQWLRFSLRMLLLVMALLCVGFAWLAVKLNAARQQHAIIAAILDAGGKVNFDYEMSNQGAYTTYYTNAPPPTPAWLRAMLGDDFFRNVVKVEFFGKKIPESIIGQLSKLTELRELRLDIVRVVSPGAEFTRAIRDDDLAAFAGLTKLRNLSMYSANLNGPGLQFLANLKSLENLDLESTHIDDAGFEHIAGLTGLVGLRVSGTRITDVSVERISGLPKLTLLNLSQTAITDAGLAHLEKLRALENLFLDTTKVSAEGLQHLASCPIEFMSIQQTPLDNAAIEQIDKISSLRVLILGGWYLTDENLQHLHPPSQLTSLNLYGTNISDAGLANLKELRNLQEIKMTHNTRVTPAGVRELHKSLPKVRVSSP